MSASTVVRSYEKPRWKRRLVIALKARNLMPVIEAGTLFGALIIPAISYLVITAKGPSTRFLTPALVALLLVANLVPIMGLMVLMARRFAKQRALRSPVGGRGRLHVRLVALFSVIASVPTLLVVIFASFLFQSGVTFWFSDRARTVLESADGVAQSYVAENRARIIGDVVPMAGDLRSALNRAGFDDPRFSEFFAQQVVFRSLDEAAIVNEDPNHVLHLIAGANLDSRSIDKRIPRPVVPKLADGVPRTSTQAGDRVEAVIQLDKSSRTYLYISRRVSPKTLAQVARARSALNDYNAMVERSRTLQFRFNAALLLVSLLIVGAVIWIALTVADRLVRPVGELVEAARKVTGGDLSARVASPRAQDEVGTLASTFNRMTERLEEQTSALVNANSQLETRRAFSEAVLAGVSAGVISIDPDQRVTLLNSSAARMLGQVSEDALGQPLASVAPELADLVAEGTWQKVIQMGVGNGEPRTLAVTLADAGRGHVLTFDDITERLSDQRRAAWADVARRVAHEIKNPLTPIQLAAERLQRRYAKIVGDDSGTFERLTGTIVRQVGDLRRMVDEFSSFARMPKPLFREEALTDIARQALFLHEVAHPQIDFRFLGPDRSPVLICDRRQLGQAFINIVKNAVEAIEAKEPGADGERSGTVSMTVEQEGNALRVVVGDDGIGLPAERERLTEPYMTTRARGTGLGLAIVKKIVEEHLGTITFSDRPGGGTIVTISFDAEALAAAAQAEKAESEAETRPPELTRAGTG